MAKCRTEDPRVVTPECFYRGSSPSSPVVSLVEPSLKACGNDGLSSPQLYNPFCILHFDFLYMTPSTANACTSLLSNPSSPQNTSSLCCPKSSAGDGADRLPSTIKGLPACWNDPSTGCLTVLKKPRAWICESFMKSVGELTGSSGIPCCCISSARSSFKNREVKEVTCALI